MPNSRDALHIAVAGKGVERGMVPEITSDHVILRYQGEVKEFERVDNLNKQSIRSLAQRMAGDRWKVHINSMGETGFMVEFTARAGVELPPPAAVEVHEQVEPGPVTAGQEVDLEDPDQIKDLATQLLGIAEKLSKIAGAALLLGGPLA